MPNQIDSLDSVFHALSDPTRRAVLAQLATGPASVKELAAPYDMALPSFLQHIKVLEESGLLISQKQGRVRTCELTPEALEFAAGWIEQQRTIWNARLDRLEAYLETLKAKRQSDKRSKRDDA